MLRLLFSCLVRPMRICGRGGRSGRLHPRVCLAPGKENLTLPIGCPLLHHLLCCHFHKAAQVNFQPQPSAFIAWAICFLIRSYRLCAIGTSVLYQQNPFQLSWFQPGSNNHAGKINEVRINVFQEIHPSALLSQGCTCPIPIPYARGNP